MRPTLDSQRGNMPIVATLILGALLAGVAAVVHSKTAARVAQVEQRVWSEHLRRLNEVAIRRVAQYAAAGYIKPGTGGSPTLKSNGFVPDSVKATFDYAARRFTFTECLPASLKASEAASLFASDPTLPSSGRCINADTVVQLTDRYTAPYLEVEATTRHDVVSKAGMAATTRAEIPIVADIRVLVFSMQPAGSSPTYESYGSAYVAWGASEGYQVDFSNRRAHPTLTRALLDAYDVVWLESGCGGATGMPSAADLAALKGFFQSGGSLLLMTDDDVGDINAVGSCQTRINPINRRVGFAVTGLLDYSAYGCMALRDPDPTDTRSDRLVNGITVSPNTPGALSLTAPHPTDPWVGAAESKVIGRYVLTGAGAIGIVDRTSAHGVAFISAAYGLLACRGKAYLETLLHYMGKKP